MLQIHQATVRRYIHEFNQYEFASFEPSTYSGRPPKLTWTKEQWEDLLAQSPSDFDKLKTGAKNWTQKLLSDYFHLYKELKMSQPTLSKSLRSAGINWRRARLRVHSPDPDYVVKRERITGLRQMALSGELSANNATDPPPEAERKPTYLVYFDAADLNWCPGVGATYTACGTQVKVDSPGKSNPWYALLGSLIYPSGDGHYTIHNHKRSDEFIVHLQGLIDRDPHGFWFVILDNASAHKSPAVKTFLADNQDRLELVFLPTYSPHLNLIERLWRVMRHQVTRNVFFESLDALAEAVTVWLEKLPFNQFCSVMGVDENQLQFVNKNFE